MFPRCGVPDAYGGWDGFERYVRFLYETGSIDEHTQLWWSVRPHLAFPTVEIRICDAQPDLAEAQSLAAFGYSLAARIARALDEGEPLPDLPHRLIEENMWRAIRYGLSGELIDFDARRVRARRARELERAARVGRARSPTRSAPRRTWRSRRRTRPSGRSRGVAEGATLRGDLRRAGRRRGAGRWLRSRATRASSREALARLRIEDLLVQTLVTVSSLGYRDASKLGDGRDLDQARLAIDAIARARCRCSRARVDEALLRDFEQVPASNLQLAYARDGGARESAPDDAAEEPSS